MISPKQKIYLTFLIFAVVFGLLIKFTVILFLEQLKLSSESLVSKKNALYISNRQLDGIKDFQKSYSLYEPILKNIDKSFVYPEAPIEFVEFLEEESKKFKLPTKISPISVSSDEGVFWPSVGFSILTEGRFSDCLKFLERLEQSPWFVEIFQLTVVKVSGGSLVAGELSEAINEKVMFTINLKVFSKGR